MRQVLPINHTLKYWIMCCSVKKVPYYAEVFFKESQDLFIITDLNVYQQNS